MKSKPNRTQSKNTRCYSGIFVPKNPEKYAGDVKNIVYRSMWEKYVMAYLDTSSAISHWGSEEVVIPYISPVDGRAHRYFTDFIAKDKKNNVIVIEVKPDKEQYPPKKQGKKPERYMYELKTYLVNKAKWKAAEEFCEKKGWKFVVMTEKHIFGGKPPKGTTKGS